MAPPALKKTLSPPRNVMSLADKLQVLNLMYNEETIASIARRFKVNKSAIRQWIKLR